MLTPKPHTSHPIGERYFSRVFLKEPDRTFFNTQKQSGEYNQKDEKFKTKTQ